MKIKHAMILAAGLGSRMKPITLKTPKSLIKIGNKSLLERAINLLENYGIEQISINTHHLGHLIEKFILREDLGFYSKEMVDTIDRFQGDERDVIIFSMCLSDSIDSNLLKDKAGSISVMDKHHATSEPAPEPLPGPTGIF